MKVSYFKDKKVLVFGLGILGGGAGVVKTLLELGATVRITDMKNEEHFSEILKSVEKEKIDASTFGSHRKEDIDWADIVIKNPAVPSNNEFIQYAFTQHKHVTTEAALYLKLSTATTVGITGTRGKTTTTMMIYEVLKAGLDNPILLGGNIQHKGCLPLLLEENEETLSVIELSSWALEGCHWEKVSPNIAVITNLYPDHLNRYDNSMERYAKDKAAIIEYQSSDDHAFLHTNHEWFEYFRDLSPSHIHLFDADSLPTNVTLKIAGTHNRENAAAAMAVGTLLQIDRQTIIDTLEMFTGVQYRQQVVGETATLQFINDSTSTTPKALEVALDTFPTATFIIGGTTKNIELDSLVEKIQNHHGQFVFLKGSGTDELLDALQRIKTQIPAGVYPAISGARMTASIQFDNLKAAFDAAIQKTPSGTIVFSPGFTSFELFKNEFDRAEQFDTLVHAFIHNS